MTLATKLKGMSDNKRKYPRYPMAVSVRIEHPAIGEKIVKTRNISDGGIFLIIDPSEMPAVGEIVRGQVQGMIENPPVLEMEIVRTEPDGLGLRFIEEPLVDEE